MLSVSFGLLSAGCYDTYAVKPAELPKINGSFVHSEAVGGNATLVTYSVAHVEAEDGRMLELTGKHDVILTLKDGKQVVFQHPVTTEPEGDGYALRGGNRGLLEVKESDIKRAEVTQYDSGKTLAAAIPLAIVGGLLLGFVAIQATK